MYLDRVVKDRVPGISHGALWLTLWGEVTRGVQLYRQSWARPVRLWPKRSNASQGNLIYSRIFTRRPSTLPNLLIVDDDPSIRALLTKALQSLGEIQTATGGLEALKALSQKRFDCILLDLHMPGLGGIQVLDILAKKDGPNRGTPVYVLTADTTDEARVSAFKRSAVYFLTKPVSIMTLRTLVQGTLDLAAQKALGPLAKLAKKPDPT